MEDVEQRAPVGPGKWTLHLGVPAQCDGSDTHNLSASGLVRMGLVIATTSVFVLVIVTGQLVHLGAVVGGLCLGAWLSAGYSMSLRGDTIVVRRCGTTKHVWLGKVSEVQYYQYRNATALRLLDRNGKRLASVSTRSLTRHPDAAAHLRRWLDRPEVSWGPSAWSFVEPHETFAAGTSSGEGEDSVTGVEHAPSRVQPQGRRVKGRPTSKWMRGVAKVSMAMFAVAALVLLVLVPVSWSDYELSQRIQHGNEALAALRSEWMTSSTDRYGTHHTTHFDVTFRTASGNLVSTEVDGPGIFTTFRSGAMLLVRYDPAHPQNAELPGYPNHTLSGALSLTAVSAGMLVIAALMVRNFFTRRKRRAPEVEPIAAG